MKRETPNNNVIQFPTGTSTRTSRLEEWAQLFEEYERLGLEGAAIRASIMLRNCGPERAKRYWEEQLRARGYCG